MHVNAWQCQSCLYVRLCERLAEEAVGLAVAAAKLISLSGPSLITLD